MLTTPLFRTATTEVPLARLLLGDSGCGWWACCAAAAAAAPELVLTLNSPRMLMPSRPSELPLPPLPTREPPGARGVLPG
jgi:hypothetical protein